MNTGSSAAPATTRKYSTTSSPAAFRTYGGMAITASAPTRRASRANCAAWRALVPETPMTTGRRRPTVSTTTAATRIRSASVRLVNSLALTGATRPWAPARTQNSTQRRRDASSSAPSRSKGVTGMV